MRLNNNTGVKVKQPSVAFFCHKVLLLLISLLYLKSNFVFNIAVVALIIFTLLLFSLRSLVSPAPTNAPKPSVLSQSLLSDLEGLSLSNISSAVQVSVCVCVCVRVLDAHRLTFPPSMCVESQSFLSVWHWQYSRAAYEMVKWASLPCGTFLLQTPTIDLFCLVIFIASQDGPTALAVSCISYSLSFSPSLSFALPHPWSLFLSHLWVHPLSLSPLFLSPPPVSPSISLCQMLCPLCPHVVYIWWLTFPSVTAPFSPQYVSDSACLCILYLVSLLGGKCPDYSLCCCCVLFCVTAVWKLCSLTMSHQKVRI